VAAFGRNAQAIRKLTEQQAATDKRIDDLAQQFDAFRSDFHTHLSRTAPAPQDDGPHRHLPKALEDYSKHVGLLRVAADIATARLDCHRDTWAYLTEKAAPQSQHFRTPGDISDEEGRITTVLSGRSLIAILTALWSIAHKRSTTDSELGDWALAVNLYEKITGTIERLQHGRQRDNSTVVITIDRRRPTPCHPEDTDED
jgi:hypothetical protein